MPIQHQKARTTFERFVTFPYNQNLGKYSSQEKHRWDWPELQRHDWGTDDKKHGQRKKTFGTQQWKDQTLNLKRAKVKQNQNALKEPL